jgi:predicted nucleic acid-binding protein
MGLTHVDAGVIIAFLDRDDIHHDAARAALSRALDDAERLAIAASALAECLVGPARRSTKAVELARTIMDRLPVSVVHLDAEIATRAASLRARHRSLKLPDALVLATAVHSDADHLITTDRRWPTAKAMKLTVSIEQIGSR